MRVRLEKRDPTSLIPYGRNSKLHSDNDVVLIVASIERFGFNDPIAIDETGEIIEGHGRLEAARQLGMTEVPVIVLPDLDERQKKLYRIAHNKIALSSTFDFEALVHTLRGLTDEDITMEAMGFSEDVADNLLRVVFPEDGNIVRELRDPVEPFEFVWDDAAQRRRWANFTKRLKEHYPHHTQGEALTEFVRQSGILDGVRRNEEGNEEEAHVRESL